MQESLLANQVLVVIVIEARRRVSVERGRIVIAAGARAIALQRCLEGGVYVGLVVDSTAK